MPEVGVRELKTRASEILRDVRDHQAEYIVTVRGMPVGMLVPLAKPSHEEPDAAAAWDEFFRVGEELMRRGWRSPLTSDELLSEMRR
ncbi:MAG TPA: type II toxin-antitoxin system prevent-host-death family antitoxin [Steroidobacteraceae bacterium]|nr:type II toxin-antitoxin system prevent-host-death family antitoxin [Steroidobacteraceae bacterium]